MHITFRKHLYNYILVDSNEYTAALTFLYIKTTKLICIGVGGGRAGRATALPIFSCFSPFSVTVCWSETQEKGRAATVAKKRFLNEEVEGKRKLRVARNVRTQLTE